MNSRTTRSFWKQFDALPAGVRDQARKSYRLWRDDPSHPSLHFKRVHTREPLFSIRVSRGYRALGLLEGDMVTWMWIGSHGAYERVLA